MTRVVPQHEACVCVGTGGGTVGVTPQPKTKTEGGRRVSRNTHTELSKTKPKTRPYYSTSLVLKLLVSKRVWSHFGTTEDGGVL